MTDNFNFVVRDGKIENTFFLKFSLHNISNQKYSQNKF